jgi:sentrin-specific protease 1
MALNKKEILEPFWSPEKQIGTGTGSHSLPKLRIPIDNLTKAAIHDEVTNSVKLPATIYTICLALSRSECLACLHLSREDNAVHSSNRQSCLLSISEKERRISSIKTGSVIQRGSATLKTFPNDMSMLLKSFGTLTVASKKPNITRFALPLHTGRQKSHQIMEKSTKNTNIGGNDFDPRIKTLRKALLDLSKRVGSTSTKCHSWREVVNALSDIIEFPEVVEDHVAEKIVLYKQVNTGSLKNLPLVSDSSEETDRGSLKSTKKRKHYPFFPSSCMSTATVPLRPLIKKHKVHRRNFTLSQWNMKNSTVSSRESSFIGAATRNLSFQAYLDRITRAAQLAGQLSYSASSWRQVISFGDQVQKDILGRKLADDQQQSVDEEDKDTSLAMQLRIAKDKQLLRDKTLEERVANLLKDKDEEEQKRADLLSDADKELIEQALYGSGRGDEVVASVETDSVQRDSLRTLRPGIWLNDEVIHYFLTLLAQRDAGLCKLQQGRRRCHFFKSFFLTKLLDDDNRYNYASVKRWSKKVPGKDIFALDKIIFPVNVSSMHWCCAVARMQARSIQFYDSLGGNGMTWVEGIFQYIQDEHMDKKKFPLPDRDTWRLIPCQANCPQQDNGYDCGVFTCAFADYLSLDKEPNFGQSHVTELRHRIALSIIKGNVS